MKPKFDFKMDFDKENRKFDIDIIEKDDRRPVDPAIYVAIVDKLKKRFADLLKEFEGKPLYGPAKIKIQEKIEEIMKDLEK